MPSIRLAFVCLLSLFLAVSVQAQEEPKKEPSLQNAKTAFDVFDYLDHETAKIDKDVDLKQHAALRADILMRASDKLLEIAKDNNDRSNAYNIRLGGFQQQILAEIEGAQQKMEAFLDELAAKEETRYKAEGLRFQLFISEAMNTINTPEGVSAFKSGLKTWIYRNIDSDTSTFVPTALDARCKGLPPTSSSALSLLESRCKWLLIAARILPTSFLPN